MRTLSRLLILLTLVASACASTVQVAVGNTGCRTKQLTVQRIWKSMPGVRSVVIVPRKSGERANQRVFIISTDGPNPDQAALTLSPRSNPAGNSTRRLSSA